MVFTRHGLPTIRPVSHLVNDGLVIIRTRLTSRLTSTIRDEHRTVVAYEADQIEPERHTGWAVVVTGNAFTITDPDRITRYEQSLRPWVRKVIDTLIVIEPVTTIGIRLVSRIR
ncbi:pyridoxamine 5'-phosphate oxidase family protein [Nocardia wallacei]|uniref:pyridoxamine 5'-phosphate oxidase family protein n=1 Tax=Nocardia wallacei TaxID=480035 RepID=UPI002453EA9A|nr:pyridoxamine 5'-phosphate oxidase family protein [Nocardia wallacei]